MRFLLHPTAALTKKIASTSASNNILQACKKLPGVGTSTKLWGQQCNPNCGCVLRFETIVDEQQMIQQASYVAKSIVLVPEPAVTNETSNTLGHNNKKSTTERGNNASRRVQPLLTNKGRPMLQECSCTTLHALAATTVSYMTGHQGGDKSDSSSKSLQQLRSDLEFHSVRSSVGFRHAALRAQNLPPTATSCFDVFEEALTATVKGYLPRPRLDEHAQPYSLYQNSDMSVRTRTTTLAAMDSSSVVHRVPTDDYNNTESEAWPLFFSDEDNKLSSNTTFGFVETVLARSSEWWNKFAETINRAATDESDGSRQIDNSSTLALDAALPEVHDGEEDDWISYVDKLRSEQQQ